MAIITFAQIQERVAAFHAAGAIRPVVMPLGHAVVAAIRAQKQDPRPLTRQDLQEIAEKWGVRIDDLWPLISDDEPAADDRDDAA